MPRPERTAALDPRAALCPVVLFALLLGIGVANSPVSIDPVDLLLLALAFGGIALALSGLLAAGLRAGVPPTLEAAALAGAVVVLQWRERTGGPVGVLALVALTLVVGLALVPLARRAALGSPRVLGMRAALIGAGLTLVVVGVGYPLRTSFRWQLLNHHKLLGTPAWFALSPALADTEASVAAGFARVVLPGQGEQPAPEPRAGADAPHVVFVLIDTLRADALAAYGGEREALPALNALADESLVLDDVSVNASWTRASMASFFTGLLPEEHGARSREHKLAEAWTTLPERLSTAGYATAAFATNFLNVGVETGFAQGFETFDEIVGRPYARAEVVHERVAAWLDARDADDGRPSFLYLHYMDPHMPYLAGGRSSGGVAGMREGYRAELVYLDGWLEQTLARIRAALADRPIALIVTSDHGEEFGEHGGFGHGRTLYREVLHVPALVHLSRRPTGARSAARLDSRDLFELTLLLTHGASFDAAAWADERSRSRRYASQYQIRGAPATRPDFARTVKRRIELGDRALLWSGYGPTSEIYDLARDPGEATNIEPHRADLRRELERALDAEPRFWSDAEAVQHSEETLRLLKALGYG